MRYCSVATKTACRTSSYITVLSLKYMTLYNSPLLSSRNSLHCRTAAYTQNLRDLFTLLFISFPCTCNFLSPRPSLSDQDVPCCITMLSRSIDCNPAHNGRTRPCGRWPDHRQVHRRRQRLHRLCLRPAREQPFCASSPSNRYFRLLKSLNLH
jgi:hypothetical protein